MKNPIYHKLITSYRWTTLRAEYLAEHPLCEECERMGRTTAATQVHHKIPIETMSDEARMAELCYDWDNLQALCYPCHRAVHMSHPAKRAHMEAAQQITSFSNRFLGGKMRRVNKNKSHHKKQ